MSKGARYLILISIIIFVSQGVAAAPLPEGGEGFSNAVKLELDQTYDREIANQTAEYFYIEGINAGEKVDIQGYYSAGEPDCGLILNMYNKDRNQVGFEFYEKGFDLNWLPNSDQDTYTYYITVNNAYCPVNLEELKISSIDSYDANSTTDAGSNFDTAMSIEEGDFTGWMSGDSGTDEVDTYSTQTIKGEELSIELTPDPEEGYEIIFYDQDRNQVARARSENTGAITRLSHRSETDQTMYIQIDQAYESSLAEYSFEVSKNVPEQAELTVETEGVEGEVLLAGEVFDTGYQELNLKETDTDTWATTVDIQPETNYMVEFQSVSGYESPDLTERERIVNLEPGESETITGTYVATESQDTGTEQTTPEPSSGVDQVVSEVMDAIGLENIILAILIPVVILLLLIFLVIAVVYFFVKKMRQSNTGE